MIWWIAQNTIVAAMLAGAVWLVCRCVRIGPAARHALWLLVLIKLIAPPVVAWPWTPDDVLGFVIPGAATPLREATASGVALSDAPSDPAAILLQPDTRHVLDLDSLPADCVILTPQFEAPVDVVLTLPPAAPPAKQPDPVITRDRVSRVAVGLWAFGAVIAALVHLLRAGRVSLSLRRASAAPDWLVGEVEELARVMNLRPPAVVTTRGAASPYIWGLGRAVLVWPERFTSAKDAARWRGVIVHELAHLRRRDHWVGWLELAAICLWWWHPLLWYVRGQLHENAELACDAWVAAILPGGRRAYAEALLTVCRSSAHSTEPWPALGVGAASRRAFERRLTMLFCDAKSFRLTPAALMALGLLALLTLPGWSQTEGETSALSTPAPASASVSETTITVEKERSATPANDVPTPAESLAPGSGAPLINATESSIPRLIYPSPVAVDVAANAPTNRQPNEVAAPASRERQLQQLEARLQELSAQIQALRGGESPSADGARYQEQVVEVPVTEIRQHKTEDGQTRYEAVQRTVKQGQFVIPAAPAASTSTYSTARVSGSAPGVIRSYATTHTPAILGVEMLSRKTYDLPQVKAEALLAFLQSHVEADVDAVVKEDSIVITTSLENQAVISRFVDLMQNVQAKTPEPARSSDAQSTSSRTGVYIPSPPSLNPDDTAPSDRKPIAR